MQLSRSNTVAPVALAFVLGTVILQAANANAQQSDAKPAPNTSARDQLRSGRAAWDRAAKEAADKERILKEKERFDELQTKADAAAAAEKLRLKKVQVDAARAKDGERVTKSTERLRTTTSKAGEGRNLPSAGSAVELRKAADAYFRGDYAVAAELLRQLNEGPNTKRTFYVDLFRAASLHSLYALRGQRDNALATAAAKHVAGCHRFNPQFVPDSRAFSPRFIDFYMRVARANGRA